MAKNEVVKDVAKPEVKEGLSERFTMAVLAEFGKDDDGQYKITDAQRRLVKGYFIQIDKVLADLEAKRIERNSKNSDKKYDNNLAYTWNNLNLRALALDCMHYSKMGLDMMQSNHLHPIPYKNRTNNNYDMTLMRGYSGIEYVAKKYALDPPVDVVIELIYSTDSFKPIKKDLNNKVEGYEFTINNPFDRGEIIGGFGYIVFSDPSKNKLIMMSKAEVEKRKPTYASVEFWGGEKDEWKDGKKAGKVQVDGWYAQMFEKTIRREVFSQKHIPLDPSKIDEHIMHLERQESLQTDIKVEAEIEANANQELIGVPEAEYTNVDIETGEILEEPEVDDDPFKDPPF